MTLAYAHGADLVLSTILLLAVVGFVIWIARRWPDPAPPPPPPPTLRAVDPMVARVLDHARHGRPKSHFRVVPRPFDWQIDDPDVAS